ncbi:MAG: type II secretion system F family protein [Verrucomicrobia bacterium]|nr:type II secretion system F family protein [Verrucomicrobiota bacterium]
MFTTKKPRSRTPGTKRTRAWLGSGVGRKSVTLFTRQLATLLHSGLPLLRSLELLERQQKKQAFRQVIQELAQKVRSGNPLSEGLALYPKVFNNLFYHMVRAGEASGHLDLVLDRLARFMEKAQKIQGKIMAAMMYPVVVMVLAVTILGFLMVYVVPRFQSIYENFLRGAALPALTQWVLNISLFVQSNILVLLLLGLAGLVIGKALGGLDKGRYAFDFIKLRLPVFGELIRKNSLSRFARTLSTLLGSAVPLLEALEITSAVVGNRVFQRELQTTYIRVRDGDPISKPLSQTTQFPDMVCSLIEVGEETGKVPEMLHRIADNYDEELDNSISALTSVLEPIMIVFLAVVVGVIVIALFLPLIGIFQNLAA